MRKAKAPSHILISRTDSIGDVLLTLPMAGALKYRFPQARISFLGQRYTRPVIESCRYVDQVIDWETLKASSDATGSLKKLEADIFLLVYPHRQVAWQACRAGIPRRIGTARRWFTWFTCNKLLNLPRRHSELHEAQLNLKMLRPIGITQPFSHSDITNLYGFEPDYPLPDKVAKVLSKDHFNLILHPRSQGNAREWSLEKYRKLIETLSSDKFRIFITGTEREGLQVRPELPNLPHVTDLTGKLSLKALLAFIKASDGMVAASTGPLHIAAALGKHAVGLYAPMRPIHPGRWAPIGTKAKVFVLDKDCVDCRKGTYCYCICDIKVADVAAYLNEAVEG